MIGIQLPKDKKGNRTSTLFNKNVWLNAAKGSSSELSKDYMIRLEKEKNWRWRYMGFVEESMKLGNKPKDCLEMAKSAWDHVYESLEVYRELNATPQTILKAMNTSKVNFFDTGIIYKMRKPDINLQIPYKGEICSEKEMIDLISKWISKGVIEKDAGDALLEVSKNMADILPSLEDKVFVLLGAISEMGPLQQLLSWGATIVAIDLNRKDIQDRLIKIAKNTPGKIIIPLKKGTSGQPFEKWSETCGANILTDFPEIAEWLTKIYPEKQMIIGSFCYLDGEMFIKIVAAMDAICKSVSEKRSISTGLAFYATPTDVHPIRNEAFEAAQNQNQSFIPNLLASFAKSSYTGKEKFGFKKDILYVNNIVPRQGPNYILAKRLQTWRAILHRSQDYPVSLNIAPSTMTKSVMHNKLFSFTMAGTEYYNPLEIFSTETTKSIMAALMVWDFWSPNSCSNPSIKLDHPFCILQSNSIHGGMYRTGYKFNDLGHPSFILIVLRNYWWLFVIILLCIKYVTFNLI